MTIEDIGTRTSKTGIASASAKVTAKDRDKETGATWSGHGPKPKQLAAKVAAGQKIEEFAV